MKWLAGKMVKDKGQQPTGVDFILRVPGGKYFNIFQLWHEQTDGQTEPFLVLLLPQKI